MTWFFSLFELKLIRVAIKKPSISICFSNTFSIFAFFLCHVSDTLQASNIQGNWPQKWPKTWSKTMFKIYKKINASLFAKMTSIGPPTGSQIASKFDSVGPTGAARTHGEAPDRSWGPQGSILGPKTTLQNQFSMLLGVKTLPISNKNVPTNQVFNLSSGGGL